MAIRCITRPATNTFASKTKDGAPKTMFKPDPAQHGCPANLGYFNAQKITELDPSLKVGLLVTPLPDAKTVGDWITAIIPDQAKNLVDYVITSGYVPGNAIFNSGNGEGGSSSLLDPQAETHVLYGDGPTSGGHLSGVEKLGKSEFPSTWTPQDITNAISDIATNPNTQWSKPAGNGYVTGSGTVNGVEIKVLSIRIRVTL